MIRHRCEFTLPSRPEVGGRNRHHRQTLDTVEQAGFSMIAFTMFFMASRSRPEPVGLRPDHIPAEEKIRERVGQRGGPDIARLDV